LKIIFASQNQGKVKEIKCIFKSTPFEIVSLKDLGNNIDIIENGLTFYDNALIKVKAVFEIYKEPVFSDDSGLVVEQLDGRPGVISARYAGVNCTYDDNNLKIIKELENFSEPHRAKFVSTAVFYDGEQIIEAVGELYGRIIKEQRGTNGFGYDPIFIPDGFSQTIGELEFEVKNRISHRAKSFEKLMNLMSLKYFDKK
jgi:XTP/dITP diphosphohydrolase